MQAVKGVSHVISWEVFTKSLQLWGSGHWARKAKLTLTKFLLTLFKYCLELFGDLSFLQNEKKTNMSTSEAACAPTHTCSQTHTLQSQKETVGVGTLPITETQQY